MKNLLLSTALVVVIGHAVSVPAHAAGTTVGKSMIPAMEEKYTYHECLGKKLWKSIISGSLQKYGFTDLNIILALCKIDQKE